MIRERLHSHPVEVEVVVADNIRERERQRRWVIQIGFRLAAIAKAQSGDTYVASQDILCHAPGNKFSKTVIDKSQGGWEGKGRLRYLMSYKVKLGVELFDERSSHSVVIGGVPHRQGQSSHNIVVAMYQWVKNQWPNQ
jgi:hypothetical protein